MRATGRAWMTLLLLAAGPVALAGEVDEAATLLSHYPPGRMAVEPHLVQAIGVLEKRGTAGDVPLLRDVALHEQEVLAAFARSAIRAIRARQREAQRAAWTAPDGPTLARSGQRWRAQGLGPAEASCAAYAEAVLDGALPRPLPDPQVGDPERLLSEGRAIEAIAAIDEVADPVLAARAHEEAGDIPGALRVLARQAVTGHDDATAALDAYGLDTERLLLGLPHTDEIDDSTALEILVRRGQHLTVQVLAERVRRPSASEQVTAADALGRMLTADLRTEPLPWADRELARKTLRQVASAGLPPVRPIALEVLRSLD